MTDDPRETPHDHENDSDDSSDGRPVDVEAEFARIVEAYGEEPADVTPPATPEGLAERFRSHGWADAPTPEPPPTASDGDPLNTTASWDEEGHFVPPEPPPIDVPEPPRLAAWAGVLGAPALLLTLTILRAHPPSWVLFLLAVAFIGGFAYLVATMKRDNDSWPGDDGAVL
jgi:hypothetical protein